MDFKINVVGLGHPTRWHCSLNTDWATEEEAQKAKKYLEDALESYEPHIIFSINETPQQKIDRMNSNKEAEEYYKANSNDAKFVLERKIKELKEALKYDTTNTTQDILDTLEEVYNKSW